MKSEVRGVRLTPLRLQQINAHCERMGLSFSDVMATCIEVAMPIIQTPEFYAARLAGVTVEQMGREVAGVLAVAANTGRKAGKS